MARSLPANTTGRFSPDGLWYWDGGRWLQVSPDGNWVWTGSQWVAAPQHPGPGGGGSNAPAVDVLVCFDTTGSMDDLIAPLVRQVATFVQEAATRDLDLAWGLIAFGDLRVPGDKVVRYPFTSDSRRFTKTLRAMPRFSGGGNVGETSLDALVTAATHPEWRPGSVHVGILLTDEAPRGVRTTLEDTGRALRERRIVLFCVSIKHRSYSWLAQVTGGEWWDIEEPVPFDRIFERLAHRVMTLASELWPRLSSGSGG